MKTSHALAFAAIGISAVAALTFSLAWEVPNADAEPAVASSVGQTVLTVSVAGLQPTIMPIRIAAIGNIMAWQEASIGTEANGLRLTEVRVNVGDTVRRGQLLAVFATEAVQAELEQSRAAVAEAEVALAEAVANAQRARNLQTSGSLSAQQIQQALSAERTASARLDGVRAVEKMQQLRLSQTRIVAPDSGVISSRTTTVGAVFPAGQELFRLIRGSRLEWHAEVSGADLDRLKPGQKVRLTLNGGKVIEGRMRMLAPVIDIQSRNGLAYVDLPTNAATSARAGMFARGEIEIGVSEVMTLPQSAVQLREGFNYVMRVGPDSRVIQTKVTPGERSGDRIAIVSGLDAQDRVVVTGAAFLGDGDLVQVSDAPGAVFPAPSRPASQRLTLANSKASR